MTTIYDKRLQQIPMNYDLIASLGANCSVAHELKRRFLRPFSLPFDWLCIDSSRTFAYLAHALRHRFDDFMLKENLVELHQGDPLFVQITNRMHVPYYDRRSGYRFLHLFDGRIEESPRFYERALCIMRRRIDRLYEAFSGRKVCLIIATDIPILDEHLLLLEESLSMVFPQSEFTIRLMQFASGADVLEDEAVKVGKSILKFGYRRKMNDYDFFQTNWEWHFLDSIKIPYNIKSTRGWQYRLWKHLDKRLR